MIMQFHLGGFLHAPQKNLLDKNLKFDSTPFLYRTLLCLYNAFKHTGKSVINQKQTISAFKLSHAIPYSETVQSPAFELQAVYSSSQPSQRLMFPSGRSMKKVCTQGILTTSQSSLHGPTSRHSHCDHTGVSKRQGKLQCSIR